MRSDDPYHEGEKLIQQRVGEEEIARRNGRAINTSIMRGALKFITQQPMVILGSVAGNEDVWASLITGVPGFITALDEQTVIINISDSGWHPSDPFWVNIENRPQIGMLVIELASRRRLRINGRIDRVAPAKFKIDVDEAYPNCPQYIQRRNLRPSQTVHQETKDRPAESGQSFTDLQKLWVTTADTFFVASAHPQGGVDASHRGGHPGFVRVLDDRTLRVPDYTGNSMYNTLGNFQVNPHAGLLFIDFENQRLLQMTGRADVRWDLNENSHQPTGGTKRYWEFTVKRWLQTDMSYPLDAEFLDYWGENPQPK